MVDGGRSNSRDHISNNHIFIVVALVIVLKRMSLYISFSIENETVSHWMFVNKWKGKLFKLILYTILLSSY